MTGVDLLAVLFGVCFGGYRCLMLSHRRVERHDHLDTVIGRVHAAERVGSEDQILTVDFVDPMGRRRRIRRQCTGPRRRRVGGTVPVIVDRTDATRVALGTTGSDRAIEFSLIALFGVIPVVVGLLGQGAVLAEAMASAL